MQVYVFLIKLNGRIRNLSFPIQDLVLNCNLEIIIVRNFVI